MRRALSALAMLGTLMLCGGGASAGSGGAVGGPIAVDIDNGAGPALKAICDYLGMTGMIATCPNLDSHTDFFLPQIVEIAALINADPMSVRASLLWTGPQTHIISPGGMVSAVNPPALEFFEPKPLELFFGRSSHSRLTPIAFITDFTNPPCFAGATLRDDPCANSFFYAVTTGDTEDSGDSDGEDRGNREHRVRPEILDLFFDYLPQTQRTFSKNQDIGDIMLPLVVLDQDGVERSVTTTLKIHAACAGDFSGDSRCLTASASGAFARNGPVETHSAAEVGITFSAHYGPSPNSKIPQTPHAIYEVQVPLLVRLENDPAYFGVKTQTGGSPFSAKVGSQTGVNQISRALTAFHHDVLGFSPAFLGAPVGVTPGAAIYVAVFSNNGDGLPRHRAVDTYLAIGTDGATVGHQFRSCAGTTVCE